MLTHSSLARLCRARDRLREVHDNPIPIAQIAREAGLSPFQFIRQFDGIFGETPHQYRIRARIERAKDLLAANDWPITEICLEVGFNSLGSFSDLFTRRVGVAPSVFRKRARTAIAVPGIVPSMRAPGCLTLMAAAFAIFEKRSGPSSGTLPVA